MKRYYDVVLINRKRNCKAYFVADSFSVDEDRTLKIESKVCGNVIIHIEDDEELSVTEIIVKDEEEY